MNRSRITIGVLTGVAVVAVAAVPSLASSSGGSTSAAATVTSTAAPAAGATAKVAAAGVAATAGATAKAAVTTKAVAAKTVRSVKLIIPVTTNKVGSNVTGFIQALDTTNKVSVPVAGVEVGLEEKRGSKYVEVANGPTDEAGTFAIAFTSDTNSSYRAVLKSTTGKPLYGAIVKTSAVAQVTWSARPDMEVTHATPVTYSFRVNPKTAGAARLEFASSKTPKKWTATKAVAVPGTNIVTLTVRFPTAGTYTLRGATASNALVSAGYTTGITVTVS